MRRFSQNTLQIISVLAAAGYGVKQVPTAVKRDRTGAFEKVEAKRKRRQERNIRIAEAQAGRHE